MTSNAPSAARTRHAEAIDAPRVDARAFRQGWLVRTRLDGLHVAGRITAGEYQAACEYRAGYERWQASGGSGDAGAMRVSGGGGTSDRAILILNTITRLREVEETIGRMLTALCVACVVEDRSWSWIAHHCGDRDRATVQRWTVDALRALAVAFATRRLGPLPAPSQPETAESRLRAFWRP